MRSCRCLLLLALAAAHLIAAPPAALAQDGEYDESDEYAPGSDELELRGIVAAGYRHSFQDTHLPGGAGSFDDGNGSELSLGFQAGHYLAFLLSWEWQSASHYDTHYFPFSVRMMSPGLLENRVHLFAQAGIGLFFSQLGSRFTNPQTDNERGSAVRTGGGIEVGLYDDLSAVVYGGYLWGLGSTDDYEYGTVGVGLQYRWNF